ncbi:DUF2892 domain-containing protein [Salarchaeum sp. JOR-1]|uniref:YgaP family membrane protein n=1 Tax=Salarchaeum sp. JOR-1 TaxID=2599399 RepID=UPI001198342D|nr:DUF2892 domain-containing protein [Salarchaeum sp. JOR-1]QDX40520.1 DUF2892 domain-containing protein [Salarchaeum sp. JOR-1]
MERNVGSLDGKARIGIGILALVAGGLAIGGYWAAGTVVGTVALLVGGILVVTGTTQKCPIYAGTGIDTVEKQ